MRTRIHNKNGRRTMLVLTVGNITERETKGVVNAANEGLWAGAGVCGAIYDAAGKAPFVECQNLPIISHGGVRCFPGHVVVTSAGKMDNAMNIIHAVGPVYSRKNISASEASLTSTYKQSLINASKLNLDSVSFPSISTGIFGFPLESAAKVAMSAVVEFLQNENHNLKFVEFVLYDGENYKAYRDALYALRKEVTHRRRVGWLSDKEIARLEPAKLTQPWSRNNKDYVHPQYKPRPTSTDSLWPSYRKK